jgi:PMR5 N terminal Domain
MTVHQAPMGLRAYFNSLIAFFIILFSFSILLNHIQNQTQNQVSSIDDNAEIQNYTSVVKSQEVSPNQAPSVGAQDQPPFLVDVDVTQLKNENQTEHVDGNARNEPKRRIISISRDSGSRHNDSISRDSKEKGKCDFSVGRWVYDNATRPLYSGPQCKFMHDEVACDKYGRNDTRYQHWRWQPKGCDLPR